MSNRLDQTDVPLVGTHHMMAPMQHMIATERGLILLKGASNAELRELDATLWPHLEGDRTQRVAVLLRFRALVQVFGARRLKQLFLQRGHMMIAPAVHVAARMRLNAQLGFNPLKFERCLQDMLSQLCDGAEADERLSA
jgi:hypothetical protein